MKYFISVLLTTFLLNCFASTKEENRSWLGAFNKKELTPGYFWWQEMQLRYDLESGGMQQTLLRFGALKSFNSEHELGLIMGYVQTGLTKEYRPTLQHIYNLSPFSLRSRLEFRDIENNDANSIRYRGLLRFQTPMWLDRALVIWDEPFINITREDWTGRRLFERNRFFAGVRISTKVMNLEVGYLNQYIPRSSGNLMEHIFTIYSFF